MISYFLFLCDKFIVCWIFSYISHPETMCAWNTKDDIDSNWTLEPLARLHYRCCLEKNVIPQTPFKVQICNANKCKAIVIRRVLFYLALTENQWVVDLEFVHYLYLVVLLDTLIKISICKPAYIKIMISLRLFSDWFQYVAKQNPIWYDKFTVHFRWSSHWQSIIMLLF